MATVTVARLNGNETKAPVEIGPWKIAFATITFSGNYTSGGETPDFEPLFGIKWAEQVVPTRVIEDNTVATYLQAYWDQSNQTIVIQEGGLTNVGETAGDISSVVIDVMIFGLS